MLSRLVAAPLLLISYVKAVHELCGPYDVYTQEPYLWNNNAWNADDSGTSCTYVADDLDAQSNGFEVIWQWPGADTVRGFPHVEFKPKLLPIQLSNLSSLVIDASWEMAPMKGVAANIAVDIFADADKKTSTVASKQMYEVMIWFGHFGKGTLPVGNTEPLDPPVVALLQDTEFKLYTGKNSNGQIVHSWVANRTLTTFNMDLAPLLGFLSSHNMMPVDVFLGTVQFGTETFSSSSPVKFTVTSYEASIKAVGGEYEGTATIHGAVNASGTTNGPSVAVQVTPSSVGVQKVSASSVRAAAAAMVVITMLGVSI